MLYHTNIVISYNIVFIISAVFLVGKKKRQGGTLLQKLIVYYLVQYLASGASLR